MPDQAPPNDHLAPADPVALAETLAFALRYSRGKRVHDADEAMAGIVAKRLIEHLETCGYVVMKSSHYRGHGGTA